MILEWYMVVVLMVGVSAATTTGNGTPLRVRLKPISQLTQEDMDKARQVPATPPLATSTYHLTRLLQEEDTAVERLRLMAGVLLQAHRVISKYLSSWEELVAAGARSKGFAHHPIHAYALTKHLSLGWPHLEEAMHQLRGLSHHTEWMLERRVRSGVPTSEDLGVVSGGLARLHDFYTFNLTTMALHASLTSCLSPQPLPTHLVLTARDLHRIGSHAANINIWNSSVDFMRAALRHWKGNDTNARGRDHFDNHINLPEVERSLKKAIKMHDQVLERKGRRSKSHSTHFLPFNATLARKRKYHRHQEVVMGQVGSSQQGLEQYVRLCRGEDIRTANITSRLYCRYVSNNSPLYVIGPLRMEVHSLRPYVVSVAGVVSRGEAREVREVATTYLDHSSTVKYNGDQEIGHLRTSSTAWLWEHDSHHLPHLTYRIQQLLGVNAEQHYGSEAYQVVNYGVGGHYSVHHDTLTSTKHLQYHRLATFLVYLSDVKQVINKWVLYSGQMHKVPCLQDRHAHINRPLA
ncbi:prolyl 4-hydroxylase subunit alpha-3-like isoform X2 [Panulirus ornatus]|uniref:prolyl 4-hydroxylase subunit alpha-3-like isoform X2 n=1 Tax=Panulirus ornatus TaxID=150431 RepID=UPI003A8AAAA0